MKQMIRWMAFLILGLGRVFAAEEILTLRTLAPEAAETEASTFAVLDSEGKLGALEMPRFNISQPCKVKKSASIQIYDRTQLADFLAAKIKEMPKPLFEIPAAADSRSFILVFEKKTQKDWIPHAMADGADAFPGGSRMFINLTPFPLKGSIEAQNFEVKKNAFQLVSSAIGADETVRRNVQIFADVNGISKPVSSTRWTFNAKRRGVVVVFRDPQAGDLRLYALPDNLP